LDGLAFGFSLALHPNQLEGTQGNAARLLHHAGDQDRCPTSHPRRADRNRVRQQGAAQGV